MIDIENEAKVKYMSRINKALKFIDANLDSDLSLEKIAESAHYSPYHFHRIFKAITTETVNSYITRKRIEKAASILFRRKEVPISELSMHYGFSGNPSFTRAFKNFYGISPTEFRKLSPGKFSKICKEHSKNGKDSEVFEATFVTLLNLKTGLL